MSDLFSQEGYVEKGGGYCPACGTYEVGYGSLDVEGNPAVVAQKVWCLDCGAEWWDVYRMAGYEDLIVPLPQHQG